MGPVRASRLDKAPRGSGLFADYLPLGTFRRRVVMWAVVPLFVLFLLYLLVITRHGDEFPLPDFTNQTMIEAGAGVDDLNLSYEIASHEFAPGRAKGVILNQFPIAARTGQGCHPEPVPDCGDQGQRGTDAQVCCLGR